MFKASPSLALALASLGSFADLVVGNAAAPVDFGALPVAQTSIQQLSIKNSGTAAETIADATILIDFATCLSTDCPVGDAQSFYLPGKGSSCIGQSLAPGASCELAVAFRPRQSRKLLATLVIKGSSQTARATLAGTGQPNDVDCVLDWAERQYASAFSEPLQGVTSLREPFYGRCYLNGALCLGADVFYPPGVATFAPPTLFLATPQGSQRLDWLGTFAKAASCKQ
ncbi:hypothetical protein [Chitinimonas sp.]|uniref:hypothetical protein n=1 Tax=Chitinimonas sp. TaxID=1934313 RepID=UPI0035ADC62E